MHYWVTFKSRQSTQKSDASKNLLRRVDDSLAVLAAAVGDGLNPPVHEVAGGEGVDCAGLRAVVAAPGDAVAAGGDVGAIAMSDAWERVLLPKSKYMELP